MNSFISLINLKPYLRRTEIFLSLVIGLLLGVFLLFLNELYIQLSLILLTLGLISILWNYKLIFIYTACLPIFLGILRNFNLENATLVRFVDEILIFMCIVFFVLKNGIKTFSKNPEFRNLLLCLISFSLIAFSSTIYNQVNILVLFNFLSTFIKPFLLIFLLYSLLDAKDFKVLIKILVTIGFLQVILSSIQFFTFDNIKYLVPNDIMFLEDSATGTFGRENAHLLGHFLLILIVLLNSIYLQTRKIAFIVPVILFTYSFILTYTEHDYIFLMIYLGGIILTGWRITFFRKLIFISILCSSILLLLYFKSDSFNRYFDYISNPASLKNAGKIEGLIIAKEITFSEFSTAFIGNGPASFSSGLAQKYQGELYDKYIGYKIDDIESTKDFTWSSFTSVLTEVGLLGLLLYYWCFFLIILYFLRSLRDVQDNWDRGFLTGTVYVCFFILYLSMIINIFEFSSLMFPVSVLIAYSYKISSPI